MKTACSVVALLVLIAVSGPGRAEEPPIGPFKVAGADGACLLSIKFATQLRFDYSSEDDPECGCADRTHTAVMRARRIRPTFNLSLPERRFSMNLHLSTAPGSIELMDFYFNYAGTEGVQLRAGQFKIPFTRYRIQSFQRLTFVDWAIVSPAFGAERQMGVALHNGYESFQEYAYAIGVFSGQNARAAHAVTLPHWRGLEQVNPSDLSDPAPREDFHPELALHVGYFTPGMKVGSDTDRARGGLRWGAAFSAAWDLDPAFHRDFVLRLAPEILAKYRGPSASALWYTGWAEEGDSMKARPVMNGGLVQGAYRLCDTYEVSARYSAVDLRHSPHRLEETSAGVNVYIVEHQLKWQWDAGRVKTESVETLKTNYIVRSQFQVAF
jgi:hypothetical protein